MARARSLDEDARRRRTVTGAGVTFGGLAVLAVAALTAWSWRSDLPDPVASHWGIGGRPDGFSTLGGLLGVLLGVGGGLVLAFGGITWVLGQTAVSRRIGAAATTWLALFLSIVLVGTLYVQRGLSDARDAPGVNGVLLVAVLGSLVPAVAVAFLVPGDLRRPTTESVPADAPRAALPQGEATVWESRATTSVALMIGIPIAVAVLAVAVVTQQWSLIGVAAIVVAVLVTLSGFVARVDREGLTVRSTVGWPRYRVPLDEVVRAGVIQVSPAKDFGGWGWRVGRGGRVGVVLRKGEALLVERTGGRSIAVTIDGAAVGAGVLNALADRQRSRT